MFGEALARGRPYPGTILTTPGGKPTSAISSAIFNVESAVISEGLSTTVFARCQGRAHLPAREHQRKFHARLPDHADRFTQDVSFRNPARRHH